MPTIEKGVPIPLRGRLQDRFPFDKMEPGDSIYYEATAEMPYRVRAAASDWNREHRGTKLMTRSVWSEVDGSVVGVRVWRQQ